MALWALISGEESQPKSDFALELARTLAARGVRVGGFAQDKQVDAKGEAGYALVRLSTGERVPLARAGVAPRGPEEEAFCGYAFRTDGFALARRWIEQDADADVLVLDGISKLEAAGRGHAAALELALALPSPKRVVVAARSSQLFYVMERFALPEPFANVDLPAGAEEREAFVGAVGARR
jgi:nucleoside-triphosphatase THEP1